MNWGIGEVLIAWTLFCNVLEIVIFWQSTGYACTFLLLLSAIIAVSVVVVVFIKPRRILTWLPLHYLLIIPFAHLLKAYDTKLFMNVTSNILFNERFHMKKKLPIFLFFFFSEYSLYTMKP